MSRTELHIGVMRKVDTQDKTDIEFAVDTLKEKGKELNDFYEDALEQLVDEYYEQYFLANGELWEILEDEEHEDMYVAQGTVNTDGSISYVAMYYNGGASLSEVLEEIIEKNKK